MKPFNVKLTDNDRALLETFRAQTGLPSEADAVRMLIAYAPHVVAFMKTQQPVPGGPITIAEVIEARERTGAASMPFKSRLKGEWKAP